MKITDYTVQDKQLKAAVAAHKKLCKSGTFTFGQIEASLKFIAECRKACGY